MKDGTNTVNQQSLVEIVGQADSGATFIAEEADDKEYKQNILGITEGCSRGLFILDD